jgi:hypothetical protein
VELGWRGAHGATRDALGHHQPNTAQRVIGLVLTGAAAVALGAWRGLAVGGLGWGWWVALLVTVVAAAGALYRVTRSAGPRPRRWAALRWWPLERCAWFAVANGMFLAAYAVTGLGRSPELM